MPNIPPAVNAVLARLPAGTGRAIVGLVALLIVAVGGSHLYEHWQAQRAAAAEAAAKALASGLAGRLREVLIPQQDALLRFAHDPRVVSALSGADNAAREQLARELVGDVPHGLRLRLIPRGMNQTEPDATPPFTYASLDLILKAEQRPVPPGAELHLSGTPNAHIALVRRVPPDGEPVGFLHLSVDPAPIVEQMTKILLQAHQHVEVRQATPGGAPVVIASAGRGATDEVDAALVSVAGTAWIVSVRRASSASAIQPADYLPYAALILVPALGFLWWRQRRTRSAPAPTTVYQGAIKAILSGEHPGLL